MIVSGGSLDAFAALSYAAGDQGSAAVGQDESATVPEGDPEAVLESDVPEEVPEDEAGDMDATNEGAIDDAEASDLVYKTLKAGKVRLEGLMPEGAEMSAPEAMDAKAVRKLDKKDDSVLAAYDITIKAEGAEYQPDADNPIQVQIKDKAIREDSDLEIWHIRDDGTKEQVESFEVEAGSVCFEADGFSVYVIIEHEGDADIVTPRVEFHYISPDFTENFDSSDSVYSYTAPGYEFLNKAESTKEYQISQILTNGESLEKITNPSNKTDSNGDEESFFYGWYTADLEEDTTAWNKQTSKWTGDITYTWHDPQKVNDETDITITDDGSPAVGENITWTIGEATGEAVLDEEGTAHIYLVPMYEHYHFVNFRMGSKTSEAGLRNNLLTRKLVVFGQSDSTVIRIGNVEAPSPDPAHQIFAGWETLNGQGETAVYYNTIDSSGSEIIKTVDADGNEIASAGDGYYITVNKSEEQDVLDLYPVFAEARWLYYNTGQSGNGATYVPAAYRLTNDDNKGTSFDKLAKTSRPGYIFGGWYTGADGTGTQLTDGDGNFVDAVKGQEFSSGGNKLYEITSDGKLYMYKALDSLTVYAKWEAQTVPYTVVYWLENANDDDYTLIHYDVLQGVAGQQTNATEIASSSQVYTDNKLRFAHLSADQDKDKSGEQSGIQQQEIKGDGSTIVNIYYDRDNYTMRFDIGFARKTGNAGSTTTYASMTEAEAAAYSGTVYGVVDGNVITLTPAGNGGWTYAGTESVRNRYSGFRYQETTGDTGTQYGVVNGSVEELSSGTLYIHANDYYYTPTTNNNGTQYGIINRSIERVYYRRNAWRTTDNNNGPVYTGDRFTRSNSQNGGAEYTGTVYYPGDGHFVTDGSGTTYGRDDQGRYFEITETTRWTYNNGTNYGNGTRYLRVSNDASDAGDFNLGFIDGSMQTISHDNEGWFYNEQVPATLPYSGPLYRQTTLAGTWQFSVSNTTGPNYANNDSWDTWLTQRRYDLGTSDPFSPADYTGTYTTNTGGTDYIVYYKEINAKYGQNIMSEYPGSQSVKVNGNTRYSFVGWLAQRDSYYNGRANTSLKGYFETVSEDLILTGGTIPGYNSKINNINPNNYRAVSVDKSYNTNTVTGEEGITQEFRCRYTTLDGAKKYLYRIYLADVDTLQYPAEPTDKFVITAGSGSNPNIQTPPTYYGYSLVDTKVLSQNGTEQTPSGTYNAYAVPELTDAGVGTGMIMVFRFQPNQHTITYKYDNGTELGDAEYYYNQSLSDADEYTETVQNNVPEGHYFAGWYENSDGVGNAFDFSSAKMPDGDIILYAVYKPLSYLVQIDPNGAEIDHIDHTGNAYEGTIHGRAYDIAPFNRPATSERSADSGYISSQSTYFNGVYGEEAGEYGVNRSYVPIGDSAAVSYEAGDGHVYYYVNMQYKTTDGRGVPSALRDALYVDVTPSTPGGAVDETELRELYRFWNEWITLNWEEMPESYEGMIAQDLTYDAWKSLYVQKHENGSEPQLYRKCNSQETWVFLGWFKDGESTPYNFADPVTESFRLTAHWRLDGGYRIQYVPENWMESEDGNRYWINGDMENWIDPSSGSSSLSYTDGAKTTIYKQPTDLIKDGQPVTDGSVTFRGWQLVGKIVTTDDQGHEVTTYTPLENDVYYDAGDDFTVKVDYADKNNLIYMQAVYEETTSTVRRPEIANLKLNANSGYLTTGSTASSEGTKLESEAQDFDVPWDSIGKAATDYSNQKIEFGDIQSSTAVHLYQYASTQTETASGDPLEGAVNYFSKEDHFLLGFDDVANEGDCIATYPADSVISVKRKDDKTIYAVWEPLVYMTFVNDTGVGDVTFSLSSSSPEALEIVNIKNGMFDRTLLTDLSSITVADDESITLVFPKGAEKDITISGTNELGVGKALIWNSSVDLVNNGTTTTYDTAVSGRDVEYSHGTPSHSHTLVTGEVNNSQPFEFAESLISNKNAVTVTFTSRDNAYALVLDDNYQGGGIQEFDYSANDITPVGGVPKSQVLPSTSTRVGYEFQGWAYDPDAETPDFSATSPADAPWTIKDLNAQDGFFSEGTTTVDGTKVRTLYAVWKTRDEASHVFIYKDVPSPGNQKKEFEFTVEISADYTSRTGARAQHISDTKSFKLAHGEYADLHNTNQASQRFIQTEVTLYNADGTRKKDNNGNVLPVITVYAQAGGSSATGSFNGTEKGSVTETPADYYTTTMTRLSQVNNDYPLMIGSSTDTTTNPLKDIPGNKVSWSTTWPGGSVVYKNTRETHDVTVSKELISNTSAAKTFTFSASYDDDGTITTLDDFTVTSGSSNGTALADIPAGAELTITEAADDNYDTTVSVNDGDATTGKETTFTVESDSTVAFTNTLKSYPVRFVKTDQDEQTGVVEAIFTLAASNHVLGTELYARHSNSVFYESGGNKEPLYAGETYTLTETFVEPGYLQLAPVTITVSGTNNSEFTFTDANGNTVNDLTAEYKSADNVWEIKVKNHATKDITIQKVFEDPMLNDREFSFHYSYQVTGEENKREGNFKLHPSIARPDSKVLTVPKGATDLTITEVLTDAVSAIYLTTVQKGTDPSATGTSYTLDIVNDDETITFTNKRRTVDVTVNKKVEGPGGDFGFTALLQSGSTGITGYTMSEDPNITTSSIAETAGQATFTLSPGNNGTATQVLTVPYGAHLTITEAKAEGYGTGYEVTEDGGTTTTGEDLTTGQLTITKPTTITFTNSEVIVAPTGYVSRQMPYICMGLLALLLLAVMAFGRRRRNWAAEEEQEI